MPLEFDKLPEILQIVINNSEQEISVLRTRLGRILDKATDDEDLRVKLAEMLTDAIDQMERFRNDLKQPLLILYEEPEQIASYHHPDEDLEYLDPHPCDTCIVVQDNLDASEHCHGCENEHLQMLFIPKDMRNKE